MGLFGNGFSDPYSGFPSAFDAQDMRRQAFFGGLQQMGLGIMSPDPNTPPSFGGTLGRAIGGFARGADQGRQEYEQQGLTRLKMEEYQKAQATEKRQQEAVMEWLSEQTDLDPATRNWAAAHPAEAGKVIFQREFEKPEPYTLGEGQTRFDSSGKPIASVPKSPGKPEVLTLVSPDGKQRRSLNVTDPKSLGFVQPYLDQGWVPADDIPDSPEPFTLGEGQTRYDNSGKPLASVPKAPDKPPGDIAEYQYYSQQELDAGRQPLSWHQYQLGLKKAGATAINTGPNGEDFGQPGAGLVWARDPQTRQIMLDEQGLPVAMPFKGGKAYEEKIAAELADKAAMQNKSQADAVVLDEIDRALQIIDEHPWASAGLVGGLIKNIGGSPAARVEELLIPVMAVTGFAELGRMREASTSGASGLGQLTERELKYLQSVRGSMDIRQGSEQLAYNLKRLEAIYVAARDGRSILPEDDPQSGAYGRTTIGPALDDIEKELRRRGLAQ